MAEFQLTSMDFGDREMIPRDNSADGLDLSPELEWEGAPEETEEFALICEDPDTAHALPRVHWLIYKIRAEIRKLPEGISARGSPAVPRGAEQGRNSFGRLGYTGPRLTEGEGPHRYYFALYALDSQLELGPGLDKAELFRAMRGHVIAQTHLLARYAGETRPARAA